MKPIRLLIIDDETDSGEILSMRLNRRGMETHYASSGEQGLAFLQTTPVDIVLLDVKMPGMDGLEVLAEIAKRYKQLGVIMISGHADMDSAAQGLELGASHYLLKPVDFEVLLHKIEDTYTQKQLAGQDNA